jgi:site-specific DNA-methyltransferase (adenine-specific)
VKSTETIKIENQTIYVESSEHMPQLGNDSVDVIVTSPPYNIGKSYKRGSISYDDQKPHEEYLNFLHRVFKECYRVLKKDGVFFLNIGDSARDQGKSENVVEKAVEAGFSRLQSIIWLKSIFGKGHYTPSGKNRRLNNLWENIFVLVKGPKYRYDPRTIGIPYVDKSNIGRYSKEDLRDAGDVWYIPYAVTTGATVKKGHLAPFPIELPYRCIKLVPQTQFVLDPFVGSGSTLAAARSLGIRGVILTRLWEGAKPKLDQQFIEKLNKSFTARELKLFKWACHDLGYDLDISNQ